MSSPALRARSILLAGSVAVVLLPGAVFFLTALVTGLPLGEAVAATVEQYSTSRLNLLVTGALGVVPMLVLTGVLLIHRRVARGAISASAAMGGVVGALATQLWAHVTYWPDFLPDRVAPMWPHGLELVIGPLFFAPVAAAIGAVVGWGIGRRRDP